MAGPRLFDHEEAVRRYYAGEAQAALAAEYGVSQSAVNQAVARLIDPAWHGRKKRYQREYQREHSRANCVDCGALIWNVGGRGLRCVRCSGLAQASSVREDTLRCSECRAWKPDEQFPLQRGRVARRGRHGVCGGCQATVRQRFREARKVPCANCGRPRTSPKDNTQSRRDTGLCADCYLASVRRT